MLRACKNFTVQEMTWIHELRRIWWPAALIDLCPASVACNKCVHLHVIFHEAYEALYWCLWGSFVLQKKSREETCGEGSGVEILENRPYIDGPGGSGQYTHKVYHIGMHIPSWFRSILPKAALRVEEESWNAYPYTRTRYKLLSHY